MKLLITLLFNVLALLITAKVVPGFNIDGFITAVIAALVIGFINTVIKPILSFVTAPINLLSLGLFTFVINAIILYVSSLFVPGFDIQGIIPAIIAAIVLALVSTVLSKVLREVKKAVR